MSHDDLPMPVSDNPDRSRPIQSQTMWYSSQGPSLEHFMFREGVGGTANQFNGQLLLAVNQRPVQIFYEVLTDHCWRTREARITISTADEEFAIHADGIGHWTISGEESTAVTQFDGFLDIDFGFTPSTNLLPIRRLNLAIGESAQADAIWFRFPECVFEPLHQTYTRLAADTYRYTSHTGFTGEITVDELGIPVRYADLWERVAHLP